MIQRALKTIVAHGLKLMARLKRATGSRSMRV
jgi:hypothetical protein